MKLLKDYPVFVQNDFVRQGKFSGVPATWLFFGRLMDPVPVESLVVDYYHVGLDSFDDTDVLDHDLDGLLVPLHAKKHYVSLITRGTKPLQGSVQPDWITLITNPQTFHEVNTDTLYKAREVFWQCRTLDDTPMKAMQTFLNRAKETEGKQHIPIFYFWFLSPAADRDFHRTLKDVPPYVQHFWRSGE